MSQKVYHLSHTDLDGYSCQLVTKRCFEDITYYNSNYGVEIRERLEEIISEIEKDSTKDSFILITDLNLSLEDAKFIDQKVKSFGSYVKLQLLDHHKTGFECAQKYDWYYLDNSRSATKITYDYFLEQGCEEIKELENFVEAVNAIDIWLKESELFEFGKVCMRLVSNAREINRIHFKEENSNYIFSLLEEAKEYMNLSTPHIVLDNDIHHLKKRFFLKEEDDTLENLVSQFVVNELSKRAKELEIHYDGYKGILTYQIGNVSIIGNDFLVKNPDYDFFMDINGKGNISLRANDKMDVSKMAKELFDGGGHSNAAGARFESFQDSFKYSEIKEQIQEALTIGENSNG